MINFLKALSLIPTLVVLHASSSLLPRDIIYDISFHLYIQKWTHLIYPQKLSLSIFIYILGVPQSQSFRLFPLGKCTNIHFGTRGLIEIITSYEFRYYVQKYFSSVKLYFVCVFACRSRMYTETKINTGRRFEIKRI